MSRMDYGHRGWTGACRWIGTLAVALVGCDQGIAPVEAGDPADLAFGVPLTLSVGPVVAGATGTFTVSGAAAFEDVTFVAGPSAGAGPCPAVLGGACIGVRSPHVLGTDRADGAGTAVLVWNTPGALAPGDALVVQAAIPRGASSVVTNTVATVVSGAGIDADLDGYDVAADCDDGDASVHPGAPERCDGVDTDCDRATSEDGLVSSEGVNYGSVAEAAANAPSGTVVNVCPGVYTDAVVINHAIDLVGVGAEGDVVFDGSLLTGPFDITVTFGASASGAALRNVAVVNSTGFDAVLVSSGLDVTLDRVVVSGNDVTDAPISTSNGAITLLDSTVSFNHGGAGGGLVSHGDVYAERTSFIGNTTSARAGAVDAEAVNAAVVELVDCVVASNSAGAGGGALYIGQSAASAAVTTSDFGAGATENLPADVDGANMGPLTAYQAGASFTCTWSGCM